MTLFRSMALLTVLTLVRAGAAFAQAPTRTPVRTPHPREGKADCLSCHGVAANADISSVPAGHDYPNDSCLNCHTLAATMPPSSKHAMDTHHAHCTVCHVADGPAPGAKIPPADSHANRHASTCAMCHRQEPAPPG